MYIAFDPGPVTGWAKFNNRGQELEMGQTPLEELPELLEGWPTIAVQLVLYEAWVFIPQKLKAQIGRSVKTKIPTIQAQGVIVSWTKRHGVPTEQVKPDALIIAQKWTQVKMPKDHLFSHQIAAFLHGAKWLIDHDIRPTALEMQNARKQAEGTSTSPASGTDS